MERDAAEYIEPNGIEFVLDMLDRAFDGPTRDPLPTERLAPLRDHVAQLTEHHRIEWDERRIRYLDSEGCIDQKSRSITSPPVESELSYLVALHEIGHIVLKLPSFADAPVPDGRLIRLYRNEAAVWEWALDRSLIIPSEDFGEKVRIFLLSDDPGDGQQEALQRVSAKVATLRASSG